MSGPLADVRVIELCDELGQYAGKLLADMGADVIKVEPPAGSSARTVGPFVKDQPGPNRSLNFWYHNTNKRSVVLDLEGSEADRETLRQLASTATIVLEDRAPGALAELGVGQEALMAADPGLIVCSLTPFGQTGPWANYASSDFVGLALGGPMAMNGYSAEDAPGAPPVRGHGDQGYNTACHYAVHGILAALLYRDRTGLGQHIDASMHEALSQTVEVGMPMYLYALKDVVRQTGRHAAAQRTEPWLVTAISVRTLRRRGVVRFVPSGRSHATPLTHTRSNQPFNIAGCPDHQVGYTMTTVSHHCRFSTYREMSRWSSRRSAHSPPAPLNNASATRRGSAARNSIIGAAGIHSPGTSTTSRFTRSS